MYSFNSDKAFDKAGLKEQCYENYLYGKDGAVETALAGIEGETAPLFAKIIRGDCRKLSDKERYLIYRFISFQESRTARSVNDFNLMADRMAKVMIRDDARFKGINLNSFMVKHQRPTDFLLERAVKEITVLSDLRIKILENDTKTDFLISDHPVAFYNSWSESHPKFKDYWLSSTGFALKGLSIFLPLSPRYLLVLFDSATYKCVSQSGVHHKINNEKDVFWINRLQAAKAESCLYYQNRLKIGLSFYEFSILHERCIESTRPKLKESLVKKNNNGTNSQLILTSKGDVKIGAKFNFLKVIDNNSFDGYNLAMLPLRDWSLLERGRSIKK